jgi:quinol-cytochrome oxidoreductase complex cytochrome b subunit
MFTSFSNVVLKNFSAACGPIAALAFYLYFQAEVAPHDCLQGYYASLTTFVGVLCWVIALCLGLRVVDLIHNRNKKSEGWRAFSIMNGFIMLLAAIVGYLAFSSTPHISTVGYLEIMCLMLMICSMGAMASDSLRQNVLRIIAA